ncbi:sodium channel protein Nach [Plutella xylostella]|uniref:sodium channel protein Nach n=1 Tax=Plutella xylostella TaxID=51655 RepID=UPI002032213B|nr:sodium channel protein Nach [Plutella xylostella]
MQKTKVPAFKMGFCGLIRSFCLETTIIGLKYLYLYPDKISRCFWTVTLLTSFGFALYLTRCLYGRFIEMPTRITIEDQYAPVTRLPWPAITICSPNQLTISRMEHFNKTLVDGNLTLDLASALPQLIGFYELLTDQRRDLMDHLQELVDLNRHIVWRVMSDLAQSCESFLKLCVMDGREVDCRRLFRPVLTIHGVCCIFNSPFHRTKLLNQFDRNFTPRFPTGSSGADRLTVLTDAQPWDALDGTLLNIGATRIMFHDHTELPADDDSSLVYPHLETFHSLHGTHTYCSDEVQSLPPNSRRCLFDTEGDMDWTQVHGYRNSDCDLMCFVEEVLKQCHCIMFYVWYGYFRIKGVGSCNITSIPCIIDTKRNHLNICDCPRDCDSRAYVSHMTTGNLGALPYMVHDTYKHLQINQSNSLMHFYFSNSFYVKQKQETVMSFINLASNLGGVFGLCLGCSIISVLEILFITYKIIDNYFYNQKVRKLILEKK